MRKLATIALAALLSAMPSVQAGSLPVQTDIDRLAHAFSGGRRGALVIGITDGKRHKFRCYGLLSRRFESTPNSNTEFEIGSLSKLFTGLTLSALVESNVVSLDDPIETYLPPGVRAPRCGDSKIQLLHLGTHSSGLPRDCRVGGSGNPQTPLQLFGRFEHCALLFAPGSAFSYSNIGYEVLGQALAIATRTGYEATVRTRVLRPLFLGDTAVNLNQEQLLRLADGHDDSGQIVRHSIPGGNGASGGFRSTANDLLALLDAHLHPGTTSLAAAINAACEPRFATGNGYYSCLGWFFDPDTKVYVKTGSLPGFRSYLAFSRQQGLGIVVLSASRQTDVYSIGDQLIGTSGKAHPEDRSGGNAQ